MKITAILNRALFVINVGLAVFLFYHLSLTTHVGIEAWPIPDLIVVILTSLAVMLAAVTIFIAILAIFGYTAMKEMARDMAQATAIREIQALKPLLRPNVADQSDLALALQEEDAHDETEKPSPEGSRKSGRGAAKARGAAAG